MKKKIIILIILSILILSTNVYALPESADILKQIDSITDLKSDATARVEITQKKADEGIKLYKSLYFRRDRDDSFLIIMTYPEVEKGNGYLRKGDNFWIYRRNTRTFQHINRDENIAGTGATGEDLEKKKLIEMYRPVLDKSGEIITETKLGKIPVYRFEIEARIEDVSYPRQVYWVRKDNYLPLKIESYSLSGTLMETSYFLKYTKVRDKYIWLKAIFIDEFEQGNRTVVEIKELALDKINDYVFTKAYLENLSK